MDLHRRLGLTAVLVSVAATVAGPLVSSASAQYFGRNKVRYESFEFSVLKTEHFDIYYYPQEREAVELAARMAERWYSRLSRILAHELSARQPMILYASHPDFEQTTAIPGQIGESTGGVTEAIKRRIVLPLAGPLAESDHVIGHELVHAFQYDMTTSGANRVGFTPPTALAMPLWFIEGMAEYLSLGPIDAHTAMWMRDAAQTEQLPTLQQLANPRYFPYRYGQALWAYVAGRWGDQAVGEILRSASETGAALYALLNFTGQAPETLSDDWKSAIRESYTALVEETQAPEDYGRELVSAEQGGGGLNLAPALSPDGRELIFLSEKSRFAIEMFLADAETGEIKRKILETALDPHFQSIQFISSAGSWHPEGRLFAFAGVSKGRPVISLLDIERGKVDQEFRLPEYGEIFNPSWSPDGQRIVFTGMVGGLTDLYVLDTRGGNIRRLTSDAYADLQPAWSPDGRRIAFVTDRFTTDLDALEYGDYELALLDPETGEIERLSAFAGSKNINPQWSADASSLYFISDRGGISNIYRLSLSDGAITQVTDILTGVSGISHLSPALSVAMKADRLAFSVYEGGDYNLYAVDSTEVLAGQEVQARLAEVDPAMLPPADRPIGDVMALLRNPGLGLPSDTASRETVDYRPGLSLDYIAPPSVGVGTSGFGTFVGGGTALYWSDMLGRRNLATLLQINGSFEDIAAVAAYQNLRSRWNWGFIVGQTPFSSFAFKRVDVPEENAVVDTIFQLRQTDRQFTGLLAYPFNQVRRLEFSGGYRFTTFEEEFETRTLIRSPPSVTTDEGERESFASIHQGEASAALVYDNALFGPSSPVLGQRYRFEVTPTAGTLNYVSVLADYRRYIMPVRPFTLAGRLVGYGRLGKDGDDARLIPLFLGYQTLVRGYQAGSFDISECQEAILRLSDCPVFDQLLGSRMLIGNIEFRFPLIDVLAGRRPPAVPPLELATFFDIGIAWTRNNDDEKAFFLGGERDPVSSYGVALRLNLFGAAILELDFVHPNDRADRGWMWQFGFSPGF